MGKFHLALIVALGLAVPAWAETRAVVVGVDDYHRLSGSNLKGAVADAKDISAALDKRGVKDVALFTDAQATRAAVLSALDSVVARAQPDDLVIIAFAGHGVTERWGKAHPAGEKEGDPYAAYLLGGVAMPNAAGRVEGAPAAAAGERILGREINVRLKALEARGARALFVADTCHGGALSRAPLIEDDGPRETYRFLRGPDSGAFVYVEGQDPLASQIASLPRAADLQSELPHVTFLAAVDKDHAAPEVSIPRGSKNSRGALSFAFARIIEGSAPTATPGVVTRRDFYSFVRASAATYSDNVQKPEFEPRANVEERVIDVQRDLTVAAAPPDTPPPPASNVVLVRVRNGAPIASTSAANGKVQLRTPTSGEKPDLEYDAQVGKVYSGRGDLLSEKLKLEDLSGVAEREVALRRLMELAKARPHALELPSGDQRYHFDDSVVIDTRKNQPVGNDDEYFAMIDLTATGEIQYLAPDGKNPLRLSKDRTFTKMRVVPPYGADTLVLIASREPLDSLILQLRTLNQNRSAFAAVDAIESAVGADVTIGLHQFFTAPASADKP